MSNRGNSPADEPSYGQQDEWTDMSIAAVADPDDAPEDPIEDATPDAPIAGEGRRAGRARSTGPSDHARGARSRASRSGRNRGANETAGTPGTNGTGARAATATAARNGWRQWLVFIAVAVVLALVAWVGWPLVNRGATLLPLPGETQSGESITVGVTAGDDSPAPQTLDIRTADSAQLDRALIGNVYQTLIERDDNGKLTAGLASKWQTSADGKTLTLTLKSNVTFSNGDKLDSSDVVTSLQQAIEGKWPEAESRFSALSAVTNPNATTVEIALSRPDATLPYTLAGRLGIVYDADAKTDYATKAIGSGPYTVSKFAKGESITLTARTDGGSTTSAKIGTATLRYYADDATLTTAAEDGTLDMAVPKDPATAKSITADDSSFTLADGTGMHKMTLLYNNDTESILSIPRVRQAITMMIDKQALASGREDVAQVLGGPIGPLEPGYEDLTSVLPTDVTKAQSMLTYFGARYMGTLKLVAPERHRALADAIAAQLKAAGINLSEEVIPDNQIDERIASRDWTMTITELDGMDGTADFADANTTSHYTNSDAQSQYRAAVQSTDDASYVNGLKTYARTVSEDGASDWLYVERNAIAVSSKLTGYPSVMTDERLPLSGIARK